ncbi:uncharacterized protein BHQ10_002290 [Talaromyces amestolkiae]|uniref:Uncharacterized protein n=1 Tax=Talaromyces amestolkiae TaxID=1196081 RepID=A0A364KRV5_TALAM|nr:uncharacterized protein BHQ10_002290 [Talaromyces amestolkiae]RAO66278.1 hypothetical protein BHQ10_002290 [Talaromyces amestolkiae]
MTITMKASLGDFVLPRGAGGPPKGDPSSEPALPLKSKAKESAPFMGSRHNPQSRGQKRDWYNKRRNDTGKHSQRAPQPENGHRLGEDQHQGYQDQRQYQPLYYAPANVVLEHPDYFNYNPSNDSHTPGRIYSDAYGFDPQLLPMLPASYPIFMSIPPSPPRMGQLFPSSMTLAALTAEFEKHRVWDELEEVASMWSPPLPSVDPFVDPPKSWTKMRRSQAGYHHQRSTLRPWANEFVPGRLFHPILGW